MAKEKQKKQATIYFKKDRKGRPVSHLMNFLRIFIIPIIWIFFPFRFYGNRKVEKGGCIYIGNHYRVWDIIFPACTTWEAIHFLAKISLSKNKFLNFFCNSFKTINVTRDGNDVRAILDCIKCLKNGEKISLYPEGTRNKTEQEFLPFKSGAAAMAIKAKVPIVPILIYKRQRLFRMSHILIGEPFTLDEFYDRRLTEEDYQKADEILYQKLVSMRQEHALMLESKKKIKA